MRVCACVSLSEPHSWQTTGMSACTVGLGNKWSTSPKQMYAHPRAEADTGWLKVRPPVSMQSMISAHLAPGLTHLSRSSTFHTASHSLNPSHPQHSVQKSPTIRSVSAPSVSAVSLPVWTASVPSSLHWSSPFYLLLNSAGLPQSCHCNGLKENQCGA